MVKYFSTLLSPNSNLYRYVTGETTAFPADVRLTADAKPRVKVAAAPGGTGGQSGQVLRLNKRDEALAESAHHAAESQGAEAAAAAAAAEVAAAAGGVAATGGVTDIADGDERPSTSYSDGDGDGDAAAVYRVSVRTAEGNDSGTDGQVFARLFGSYVRDGRDEDDGGGVETWSAWFPLAPSNTSAQGFAPDSVASWDLPMIVDLGDVTRVELRLLPPPPPPEEEEEGITVAGAVHQVESS
jgi:hypothetical protein